MQSFNNNCITHLNKTLFLKLNVHKNPVRAIIKIQIPWAPLSL